MNGFTHGDCSQANFWMADNGAITLFDMLLKNQVVPYGMNGHPRDYGTCGFECLIQAMSYILMWYERDTEVPAADSLMEELMRAGEELSEGTYSGGSRECCERPGATMKMECEDQPIMSAAFNATAGAMKELPPFAAALQSLASANALKKKSTKEEASGALMDASK